MKLQGAYVALVTPFKNQDVDEAAVRDLCEFVIAQGIDGIVPAGCTGEAATLTHDEQKKLIKLVVETVNKRVPVIAGTGSNNTKESLELTKYAKDAGADAAMLITPYYNKPTPQGQIRHYETVAKAVDIPIILYNVPGRTGICMTPQTIAELAKIDNIVAIKEASGSLDQVSQIRSLCDITVLSGDDSLTLPMMAIGATGVISVVGNIVPKKISQLVKAFANGQLAEAQKIHYELVPLCKAMFMETNPLPVKTSLNMMGKIEAEFRLPLCEMRPENLPKLEKALKESGVLSTSGVPL
ncbi:4-hydroxy-tetrahydrodipicolinate synthase [PVC group bacterium]|nr:4-hydroxy-tetrahydrodipicolinate synthase [PVC group bacterium]